MKKSKIFALVSALLLTSGVLAGCGGNQGGGGDEEELTGTALAVSKASKMTLEELEQASKAEVEAQPDAQFKVVGLTSVLKSVATTVAAQYDWLRYGGENDNINVKNDYKDYQLLTALDTAERQYFADYALAQDARSFSDYLEDGILHNYIPSDAKTTLGLKDDALLPLYGVHFNKLFYTNTNFTKVTGKTLHNIWQLAGTSADPDHLDKLSFQKPDTEQINMSFLVSAYAEENQERIAAAYKSYYGKDWAPSGDYQNAGQQWVAELIKNVTRWHTSDGTAMKETQLKDDWNAGYVYYGAFAKMKDAVGKCYKVDLDGNGTADANETYTVTCDGKQYTYDNNADQSARCGYNDEAKTDPKRGVNAMDTVKWDWEIEGFNGFMYCMDSQIINNAKFPYTACLFARTLLLQSTYTTAIYNAKNPDADGNAANQYGYYFPGTADSTFRYAKGDWTKEQHIEREINENYAYLKDVRKSTINAILTMVSSNKA